MHMYGDGRWNDVDCTIKTQAFFVEYGDPDTDDSTYLK